MNAVRNVLKLSGISRRRIARGIVVLFIIAALLLLWHRSTLHREGLVNISYDASRELYHEINDAYSKTQEQSASELRVVHGGSVTQSVGVLSGLRGDVLTLAAAVDIDRIADQTDLVSKDWASQFPHGSSPYASTIVFLVRKNNPNQILDWEDLLQDKLDILIPHPEKSGAGRWAYLAAWGAAYLRADRDESAANHYVSQLFLRANLESAGARTALMKYLNGNSDVIITWESEAHYAASHLAKEQVEVVTPSISIIAEPVVAIVDSYVTARGTQQAARDYLSFLFTFEGQTIIARNFLRPRDSQIPIELPLLEMFSVTDVFGGWDSVMNQHFNPGGAFSHIKELRSLSLQN